MGYRNVEMEAMVEALAPLLENTDVVGYAAARNTRVLRDELKEYVDARARLISKHGEVEVGEDGEPTGRIAIEPGTGAFDAFLAELTPLAEIEHEPQLFRVKYADAIGKMSGAQMLAVEWMLED